ncbi:MAG: ABC transporter permease, partial [Bacilli bacterium]|nr:ABC transporter permease [Bacilli bacterium]
MLSKLSFKNIQKSFKDYAIYFFTLILGVSIFYVFNAIESQTVLLNVTSNTREIIKLMTNLLSGVSVFVSVILGFLIIYASRFLIKRRNKEFGVYLTLGMSKKTISKLLFFETLFIGLISLAIGACLGIVLSQFMSLLVANMFEADLTEFAFTFSSSALIKTLIYFGIMYLLVMIFNTINVNRCKLIDLLHASKKSEEVKLKNPIICTIIFIIAVVILSRAYYLVTSGFNTMTSSQDIFKPIIMGSLSTFLIFWSLSGLILRIVMTLKGVYYKGLNSFVVRQISSKINTTVFSTTIICLMLFVTICVFSSALSIKNSMTENLKSLAPMDIEFEKNLNLTEEDVSKSWNLTSKMIPDSYLTLEETLTKLDFDITSNLKDIVAFNTYGTKEVTFKDTLGSSYNELIKEYPY